MLETAIDTDVPGYCRAIVSADVRSFDGTRILVPRSSRLVGQYKSGLQAGQSRIYVIWTRLIRPDGVAVNLGSPATGFNGESGIGGSVNTHFFARFGSAMLLSVVGGLSALGSSGSSVIIGSSGQSAAAAAVGQTGQIGPDHPRPSRGTGAGIHCPRPRFRQSQHRVNARAVPSPVIAIAPPELPRSVYLDAYLAPFHHWLACETVTEIIVNRPGEIWIEDATWPKMARIDAPGITDTLLARLAEQVARVTHQGINREHPLLGATLPDGARIQLCGPPATRAHLGAGHPPPPPARSAARRL